MKTNVMNQAENADDDDSTPVSFDISSRVSDFEVELHLIWTKLLNKNTTALDVDSQEYSAQGLAKAM